jgi:DNA-binding PadR family transcriptional regulator
VDRTPELSSETEGLGQFPVNRFFSINSDHYYALRYTTQNVIVMRDPSLLVLASLAGGKKHGYAIMQDIRSFGGVSLGPGTLYGAITRLERRGLIRPADPKGRRQPYEITGAGRAYLNSWLASLGRVVRIGLRRLQKA